LGRHQTTRKVSGAEALASESRRPNDTKSLFYEDDDEALPLLAEEIAKIPALLDVDLDEVAAAPSLNAEESGVTSYEIEDVRDVVTEVEPRC